jgi:hypothetical protein
MPTSTIGDGSRTVSVMLAGCRLVLQTALMRRTQLLALPALLALACAEGPSDDAGVPASVVTSLHTIAVTRLAHIAGIDSTGGGLAAVPGGALLVSGDGQMFFLPLTGGADSTTAPRELPYALPMDRANFGRLFVRTPAPWRFRVTSLVADTSLGTVQLYVAHNHIDSAAGCLSLRVSALAVDFNAQAAGAPWSTLFESKPCITPDEPIDSYETGGRLAFTGDGALLLSVGDHGLNGLSAAALSQDSSSPYGKIHRLSLDGTSRVYSSGHRNVQGIVVAASGLVWAVEHGPQGGDEINLLRDGANYGWPYETFGTDYGHPTWPPTANRPAGAVYEVPVHAFVPSVAPSDVLELRGERWGAWQGDLIIATLKARLLLRVRVDGDRVRYVEPINIGTRIRDAEQVGDGTLLLLTEDGDVLALRPGR